MKLASSQERSHLGRAGSQIQVEVPKSRPYIPLMIIQPRVKSFVRCLLIGERFAFNRMIPSSRVGQLNLQIWPKNVMGLQSQLYYIYILI